MLKLLLTPQAIVDFEEIFEYSLSTWGINQAEKYQDELYAGIIKIRTNPDIGSTYYFKKGNYKNLHVNRHLVFFRVEDQQCIIIRILHEKMNLNFHLE